MFIVENRKSKLGKGNFVLAAICMFMFFSFGGLLTMHVHYNPGPPPRKP
jgi:hypothetical protein